MTNTESWNRSAVAYQSQREPKPTEIQYGTDLPNDTELRLVPNLRDKRVLDLGCGTGANAVVMAQSGAKVIGIDLSQSMLELAQQQAASAKVKVELRQGDIAELAWLRAESIEFALCVEVLAEVPDLDRTLRQIHRVLQPASTFVFTHAHPAGLSCRNDYAAPGALPLGTLEVRRSYFDEAPINITQNDQHFTYFPRTIGSIFSALGRAGFGIDAMLEPEPSIRTLVGPEVPNTLIIRAKKLGN